MRYETTIKKEDSSTFLVFTRKDGRTKRLYVGSTDDKNLADEVYGHLYDFHQCDDEFKHGDEIVVPTVGTFKAESFHILPADDDTKFAILGVTRELPFRVSYHGVDGNASRSFATMADAAVYVKQRWQGIDYMDGRTEFHTDYGRYSTVGFTLYDVGKIVGVERGQRDYEFNLVVVARCVVCGADFNATADNPARCNNCKEVK